ncbi:MAG TPA: heavy metal translocating P-type ATPase [Thiotrichaceae bacterium]|nr:heavy metal translocating P-type ATPase [Thiotrichaceae bacterium]
MSSSVSSPELCYHCGLEVPDSCDISVSIDNQEQPMCCLGCAAVAKAIVDNGLTNFYQHRTKSSDTPEALIPEQLMVYDNQELQDSFVSQMADNPKHQQAALILEGIVCAACVWLNEHHVQQLDGVVSFHVNYSTHRATLVWDNTQIKLSDVLLAVADIGYRAHPYDPSRLQALQAKEKSKNLRRIAIAGVGMMQVMMLAISLYLGDVLGMRENTYSFLRWMSLLLTTPVVLFASSLFFKSAWNDLKKGRVGMDVPVSIAILTAYFASIWATVTGQGDVYFDSVNMFTFFLLVGRYLEMQARHKAGQVAEALVRLLPDTAIRIKAGKQEVIPVNELKRGDHVLIKAGGTIPADGVVLDGESSVNESLLTGESIPVDKQINASLIAGSINIESPLTMIVEAQGDHTVLSAITRLLDKAQNEKPRIAVVANQIAAWFVLILLIIATAVFSYWALEVSVEKAFWVTLSVLVVTCPCALSLATPVALTAATGRLTTHGMLITQGHALEGLAKVNHVVFDKTGTLTEGRLSIKAIKYEQASNKEQLLSLASSLESYSEHPIAKAITLLSSARVTLAKVVVQSGQGVQAEYANQQIRIGKLAYVKGIIDTPLPQSLQGLSGTQVYMANAAGWLVAFSLHDEIRDKALASIQELHQQGIKTTILSGDNVAVVADVAEQLGINQGFANLDPQVKLVHIKQYQQDGDIVVMVGDGVNDAPVLSQAQVSIAMGQGAQLAQASADMVLLAENLIQIPQSIDTAQRMKKIIKQNLSWAIIYNLAAIPLAATGMIAPWVAAIGMSASSLVVVLNSLRLREG